MAPIEGTTPEETVASYVSYLNDLLRDTITSLPLRSIMRTGRTDLFQIAFEEEGNSPGEALLETKLGEMRLFVAQLCHTDRVSRSRYRLHTREYTYDLTPAGANEPLFRWEYVRYPTKRDAGWCRHHLQGPLALPLRSRRKGEVTLNDLHLPTGYVPLEEIIRFCIHDLAAKSARANWHDVLEESYQKFRTEFTEFGTI